MKLVTGISFLLSSIVCLHVTDAACPDGFIRHGQMCYHFSHDVENWTGAKAMCEVLKSQLVEIQTANENDVLKHQAGLFGGQKSYWIALTDLAEENTWVWMNSFTHATWTHWNSGEPSNAGGDENCALMLPNGLWNDGHCNTILYYICEHDDQVEVVGRR